MIHLIIIIILIIAFRKIITGLLIAYIGLIAFTIIAASLSNYTQNISTIIYIAIPLGILIGIIQEARK